MRKLLLVLNILICPLAINAYDFFHDGLYYIYTSHSVGTDWSETYMVTLVGCLNSMDSISIPTMWKSSNYHQASVYYYVNKIEEGAFKNHTNIKKVIIPNSIKHIGSAAFSGCTNLEEIAFPNSLATINDNMCNGCTGLKSVSIPNSIMSIGKNAFKNCQNLSNLHLPDSILYSIGDSAFENCININSISFPAHLKSLGTKAFKGCLGLTNITITKAINKIKGGDAFSDCDNVTDLNFEEGCTTTLSTGLTNVKNIKLPKSITSIGNRSFQNFKKLTNISLPRTILSLEESCFDGCTSLNKISIPDSVKSIGSYAFRNCTNLSELNIPNSVNNIGSYAFQNCVGFTDITIPSSIQTMGQKVFDGCNNVKNLIYEKGCTEALPTGLTNVTNIIIPNSITKMSNACFKDFINLSNMDFLPNSIVAISDSAFMNCTGLKKLSIPNTITKIGKRAFYGCTGLTKVIIPYKLTSFKESDEVFSGCLNVSELIYSDSCTNAIYTGLVSVTKISLPNSIIAIDNSAFEAYENLKNINLPDSLTTIGEKAFAGCKNLSNFEIPKSVKSIGELAFAYCTSLTKVTIPSTLESIQYTDNLGANLVNSFYGCTNVKELVYDYGCKTALATGLTNVEDITFPSTLTTIQHNRKIYSFANFKKIKNVKLNFIDERDFFKYIQRDNSIFNSDTLNNKNHIIEINGIEKLSITIPDSITCIGNYSFANCKNLTHIIIADNVSSIGRSVFDNCNAKICVNNIGSYALLTLWNYGIVPYKTGSDSLLYAPYVYEKTCTQTSINMKIMNYYPEYSYIDEGEIIQKDEFNYSNLSPETTYHVYLSVRKLTNDDKNAYNINTYVSTAKIAPVITVSDITPSSISIVGSYTKGDAIVNEEVISISNFNYSYAPDTTLYANQINYINLDPNIEYGISYKIKVGKKSYIATKKISTKELSLITQQPKVINTGNVIVQATSNLDDAETNVGFEWRRTDWTDDFASNTGSGYLYDGTMEGYIRNLNTNYLWKYRPYYESNSGNRYYGEWVGIDPSNTSYFEPTVHTYDNVNVNGNTAKVKGYAQRGTDNITEQGFMYWKNNGASEKVDGANYAPSIPSDAQTVTVRTSSGNPIMETTLTGLDFNSGYSFVAFVTTTDGTFYGEEQTFTTGSDPTGIIEVEADEPQQHKYPAGIYDLNGRKLQQMQRGVNIVRFEDGTVKKILVK